MRRSVVLGSLIAIGALSVGLAGQQRATLPDLQKVKDNLYIIGASSPVDRAQFTGGNVGVFVTDAGVIVVDTKLAGYGPDILAKIKAVTSKPVTTIINTHTHGDHTGSNEGFPTSVNIVAHENTKTLMAKMDAFKGDKAQFLPKQTYKDKLTLGSGKDRVELYYFGKGHTGGDTMVYYPTLRVLADRRPVGVEGRSAAGPRQRRQRRGTAEDARQGDRDDQGRGHHHPGPHAGLEAGGTPGVSALHGRPARGNRSGDQGRQERRRRGGVEHRDGEVSGLQVRSPQGCRRGDLQGAREIADTQGAGWAGREGGAGREGRAGWELADGADASITDHLLVETSVPPTFLTVPPFQTFPRFPPFPAFPPFPPCVLLSPRPTELVVLVSEQDIERRQ